MHEEEKEQLINAFITTYGHAPEQIFFAPGRVNLIGEHTDYNGGYVFPAALTIGTYVAAKKTSDSSIHLASAQFDSIIESDTNNLSYLEEDDWGNYPKGVLHYFKEQGFSLTGLELYYLGNLPNGAGLSSSASIEMATALMTSTFTGAGWDLPTLAKACQHVENDYLGIHSGIMDPFAVGMGKTDHAIFLNTDTLEFELVPLKLGDYALVVTNSNKRRGLADSKYNERRNECEQGLLDLISTGLSLHTLSDLTMEQLQENKGAFRSETVAKRVTHVISENDRVKRAVSFLKEGDLNAFGQLMLQSHKSLADNYEVTGPELDTLFSLQLQAPGCIGTRMTGAGFGGCTVSLVHSTSIEAFKKFVAPLYQKQTGLKASFYTSLIGEGVSGLPLPTRK